MLESGDGSVCSGQQERTKPPRRRIQEANDGN